GPGARGWPGADGEAGLVAARCCRRGPGRGRSDVGAWTAGGREAGCGKWGAWSGEWERGAGRAWSGEWERGAGGAWSGEWERGAGGAGGAGEPHAEVRGVSLASSAMWWLCPLETPTSQRSMPPVPIARA